MGEKGRERGRDGAGEPRPTHRSRERVPTEALGKRKVSSTSEAAKEEDHRGKSDPLQALDEPRWSKHALIETRL